MRIDQKIGKMLSRWIKIGILGFFIWITILPGISITTAQITPPPQPPSPIQPLTPTSPSPIRSIPPRTEQTIIFNFDDADIYEVIRVIGEILKINYIVDPRVKGKVNIHTTGQISTGDIFPIFQSILRLCGATAVKRDGIYEIVPLSDAKKTAAPLLTPKEPGKPTEERYMIQIVPLKYIPVAEVSKMVKPFLSDGADVVEHVPHNILILGDLFSNVKKATDIIQLFDIDLFTDLRVRIYPILNADVDEIAKEMERIFTSFEVSTKSGRGVGITFTPIPRINSLLVVSSIPNIFEKVEGWLKELDKTPAEGAKLSVFVYYVQNNKAKDLAEVLKQIFVTPKEKKATEFKEKVVTPEPAQRSVKPSTQPTPPVKEETPTVPEGEINIVVDESNNALVIRAFARDYKAILETIKKLDIYPKQVLIETFMAEITLDDSNKFGIEWARFTDYFDKGKYRQTIALGPSGSETDLTEAIADTAFPGSGILRYSIFSSVKHLTAAIKAAATDNRLKVVSSPHILASNNKEAKIQIGTSEPILTSTYTTTATATTNVVEGTIEYKDIGIIVTVTPRISDAGLITLEIQVEKSDADTKKIGNLDSVPFFGKKVAKTTISVLEGQTIVIGGLIENKKTIKKSGVPLLSKIPLIGALFGAREYEDSKTELVLLMTPHIISDHIQSKSVTEDFKEKVEELKKEFEKERLKREKK